VYACFHTKEWLLALKHEHYIWKLKKKEKEKKKEKMKKKNEEKQTF